MWVIVITWDEPEEGICCYGPYSSKEEAEAVLPSVKRFFVNPLASQEEYDRLKDTINDPTYPEYLTAEQCGDMGFEWGGEIPDGTEFHILKLEQDLQSAPFASYEYWRGDGY